MPTDNLYAIDFFTTQAIEAQRRRRYEASLRHELQELPRSIPLLGRPWRAIRRMR